MWNHYLDASATNDLTKQPTNDHVSIGITNQPGVFRRRRFLSFAPRPSIVPETNVSPPPLARFRREIKDRLATETQRFSGQWIVRGRRAPRVEQKGWLGQTNLPGLKALCSPLSRRRSLLDAGCWCSPTPFTLVANSSSSKAAFPPTARPFPSLVPPFSLSLSLSCSLSRPDMDIASTRGGDSRPRNSFAWILNEIVYATFWPHTAGYNYSITIRFSLDDTRCITSVIVRSIDGLVGCAVRCTWQKIERMFSWRMYYDVFASRLVLFASDN